MNPVAIYIRGRYRPGERRVFLDDKDVTASCVRAEQYEDGSGIVILRESCQDSTRATLQGKVEITVGDR